MTDPRTAPDGERKTPDEWLNDPEYARIEVIDPDGWDRKNFDEDWQRPLTKQAFVDKLLRSTLVPREEWHG